MKVKKSKLHLKKLLQKLQQNAKRKTLTKTKTSMTKAAVQTMLLWKDAQELQW
jgi:hypothetical protein